MDDNRSVVQWFVRTDEVESENAGNASIIHPYPI